MSSKRVAPLDQEIAFNLRLAQAASFQAFKATVGDRGLRPGHYAVLRMIADRPGISQFALSRAVGRDKTTLTSLLQDMERRGLVKRDISAEDSRRRVISLTAAGRSYLSCLTQSAAEHDARLNRVLGPDRAVLIALLQKLAAEIIDPEE